MRKIKKIIAFFTVFVLLMSFTPNISATEKAKVFITGFFSTDASDRQHAINGFRKLNYSTSSLSDARRSDFLNWINSGGTTYTDNNYAFYVSTHGPSDEAAIAGETYFLCHVMAKVYPDDLSGNWHLVYIDACNSKRNNKFPVALNITGHSNRGYLGWATTVGVYAANSFNNYFWETYVTRYTIQQAAVKAAADVPGAGSTPIRFSGDTSWYGYAN